jgi:hypothetical protein
MFSTGSIMMTRVINDTITENVQFAQEITSALSRYMSGDWGDMCEDDKTLNNNAVKTGFDRIFAAYHTTEGKVYIITEHDRSHTTVLFADEY